MLVKRNGVNPVDGCQYNTLKDCEVTFRRSSFMTPTGIYAANHVSSNFSSIPYTLISDAHSFNTLEGNIITNAQIGIYFSGIFIFPSFPFLYDQGNTIGRENNGNIIKRFGSNNTSTASGIIAHFQNNLLIEGNNISGGGTSFSNTLNGIYLQYFISASVRANTISDTSSTGTNNGIFIGSSYLRLLIDSNFIVNGLSLNATFNGIDAIANDTLIISANRIGNNRYQGTSGGIFTGIQLTCAQNKYSSIIRNEIYGNYSNNSFYAINLFGSQGIGRVFNNRIYGSTCLNGQHIAIFNNQNSNQADSVVGNEIFDLSNEALIYDGYDDFTRGLINFATYDTACVTLLKSYKKVQITTAIANEPIEKQFLIYPNPVSNEFWIKPSEAAAIDFIELYGMDGKLVKVFQTLKDGAASDAFQFNVLGLNQGIYMLKIQVGNASCVKKMIIE
jgi:hypothetical protein